MLSLCICSLQPMIACACAQLSCCQAQILCVLQDIEKARQVAVEQMADVAAIKSVPVVVKTAVLKFLAVHAFFAVDKAALGKVIQQTACIPADSCVWSASCCIHTATQFLPLFIPA